MPEIKAPTINPERPPSQESRMIRALREAGSKGVPNWSLSRISLRYGARIAQLRSQGYNILCERVSLPNGRATNTFRYILLESS